MLLTFILQSWIGKVFKVAIFAHFSLSKTFFHRQDALSLKVTFLEKSSRNKKKEKEKKSHIVC